jgi:DNA-binding IscR family transcriptional regulator
MRGSCRFAVAVHVLAVLAYREGDRVSSRMLARSVNTNPVVIRRLLLVLQTAKLVETCKGAGAGSCLGRPSARIRLDEVYRAVEDAEPFCLPRGKPNAACPVGHCIQKALAGVFASVETALERELAKTSLADIVSAVKAACAPAGQK